MSMKTEFEILEEEQRYKTIVNLLEIISTKKDEDSDILNALKAQADLLRSLVVESNRTKSLSAPSINVIPADTKHVAYAIEKLPSLLLKSNEELQRMYFEKKVISSFKVKYDASGDIDTVIVNY